jgi:two-component system nitrate/nitrite response regulator NarL
MNNQIKIVIADDHPMLLNGLKTELIDQGYDIINTASNGAQALDLIGKEPPDIAIVDINMPLLNGFELIKKCTEQGLKTKFIILTSHKEKNYILRAKKINVSGYLLKEEPFSEIKRCIHSVMNGEFYASAVFNDVMTLQISPELEKIKFLSPSERTIVRLIAKEKSSKQIGEILSISYRTVQKHRTNIISKLDLSSDSDSLSFWITENIELFLDL